MEPQIRLFGTATLGERGGQTERLPTRKSWALLAYLVQSGGRDVPREELAALLWPRSAEGQARASLRQELAVLKKALKLAGLAPFQASKDTVRLTVEPGQADTTEFEARVGAGAPQDLRAAADLYAGDFLSGLTIRSGPFQEWLWLERQRLRNRALGALADLLRLDETDADMSRIQDTATRFLAIEPTQEQAHRALMRLYRRTGRRAEALQQYDRCREVLRRDLDAEPSQETIDLEARIRRDEGVAATESRVQADEEQARPVEADRKVAIVLCINLDLAADPATVDAGAVAGALDEAARRAAQTVGDGGGAIASAGPDRLLAVFAAPSTGGPVEEQAVQAALSICAWSAEARIDPALRACVGIARGEVLMAPAPSGGMDLRGAAVLTAARFGRAARAGEVLVSDDLAGRIKAVFDMAPLSSDRAGATHPAGRGWIVRRERVSANRFDVSRRTGRLTPLAGRTDELERLLAFWKAVRSGTGGVALITGDAGMGKSRLAYEFLQRAAADNPGIIRLNGSPQHRQSPLYPVMQLLRREIAPHDRRTGADGRAALDRWARAAGLPAEEVVGPLWTLLSGQQGSVAASLEPGPLCAAIICALRELFGDRPPIVLVEDGHWLDPSTSNLLTRLAAPSEQRPVFILATLRPGAEPGWIGSGEVLNLGLGPLPAEQARAVAASVLPDAAAQDVIDTIALRADGVPLIVEELGLALLQPGLPAEDLVPEIIAGSLPSAVAARIDRLSAAARDVLQIASVFGSAVPHGDLLTVTALPGEGLETRLRQLQEAELMYPVGRPPHRCYEFKHGLIQELTYSTLLADRRTACHLRVGEVLEAQAGIDADTAPELIARHFARASRPRKAIEYRRRAGRRAAALSAPSEAAAQYRAALRHVPEISDQSERAALEQRLLLRLGPHVLASRGFGDDEIAMVYDRARSLAVDRGEPGQDDQLEPILWGLWGYHITRADVATAIGLAAEFLTEAQLRQDPVCQATGQYMLGVGRFYRGHLFAAQGYLDRAGPGRDTAAQGGLIRRFGFDTAIGASCFAAWIAAFGGYVERAGTLAAGIVQSADATGHAITVAMARVFAAGTYAFLGLPRDALRLAEAAMEAARAPALQQWHGQALIQVGRARWCLGEADGEVLLRRGLEEYRQTGAALAAPYALGWLAEACLHAGRIDEGLSELDAAARQATASGVSYFEPEHLRVRGALLARHGAGRSAEAETALAAAVRSAKRAQAGLLTFRARASLAGFYEDIGRHEDALDLIETAFAELPDASAPDAQQARQAWRDLLSVR
ncbi:MAG: BTAD domain-containing putative transcriptional regulator [Rhodobacter sp.]|nr:BTAD domain-containing putative transcriptional regulator [Rhodobacter sp.]